MGNKEKAGIEPGYITYDYLFEYNGKNLFEDREISCLGISTCIYAIRDDDIVYTFENELKPVMKDGKVFYLSDVYSMYIDKNDGPVRMMYHTDIASVFKERYGFKELSARMARTFVVFKDEEEIMANLNMPMYHTVAKEQFLSFCNADLDGFICPHNKHVTGTSFYLWTQ